MVEFRQNSGVSFADIREKLDSKGLKLVGSSSDRQNDAVVLERVVEVPSIWRSTIGFSIPPQTTEKGDLYIAELSAVGVAPSGEDKIIEKTYIKYVRTTDTSI